MRIRAAGLILLGLHLGLPGPGLTAQVAPEIRAKVEALGKQAREHLARGRLERAVETFDKALALDPGHEGALTGKGQALTHLGRFDDALRVFDLALIVNATNLDALTGKAEALRRQDLHESALVFFDKALAIRPDFAPALAGKGRSLTRLGRFPEALACFDAARKLAPRDARLLVARGVALNGQARARGQAETFRAALASLDAAVKLDPKDAHAWTARGDTLVGLEDYKEALRSYARAIRRRRDLGRAHLGRGLCLHHLGRRTEAAAAFRQAEALGEKPAETALGDLARIFAARPGRTAATPAARAKDTWFERVEIPEVYCTRCLKEKRLAMKPRPFRLMERDGEEVISTFLKKPVYYLEWEHLKFVSQIPAVNLAVEMTPKTLEERENWKLLKVEIADLKKLFPTVRVGTLNPHQMAHLMMNRMIRFYKKVERELEFWRAVKGLTLSDYGMGPHLGMKAPYEIYVLKGRSRYLKWEDKFIGRRSIVGQKWHHFTDGALMFSCYYDGPFPKATNFILHNLAHLLIWGYRSWTFKLPGWLHIGYAHHIERLISPRYNTFCYDEGGEPPTVKGWRWDVKVAKAVRTGKFTPLAALKTKVEMAEFKGSDHLICWSVVKFLVEQDKRKFRDLVDRISRKIDQDEALRAAYGWSFNRLQERWAEHVITTYPKP